MAAFIFLIVVRYPNKKLANISEENDHIKWLIVLSRWSVEKGSICFPIFNYLLVQCSNLFRRTAMYQQQTLTANE